MARPSELDRIQRDIVACRRCPRLVDWCRHVARTRRRAYRDQEYWGRPVPSFGDRRGRVWILGLAPAAHGANRTGRMFTGDSSGDWLYAALHRAGFASQAQSVSRDDGQELRETWISAAVHCAPPDNKPTKAEIESCSVYLDREWAALQRLQVVIALGGIAFQSFLKLLQRHRWSVGRPLPRFGHREEFVFERQAQARGGPMRFVLLASYHPSRQNTQTGRLTRRMWNGVFRRARTLLDAAPAPGR